MSGPAIVVTTLLTTAFVSAAAAAYVARRYGLLGASQGLFGRRSSRPKWISRSKHPQVARFISEGGNVPEVKALRPGSH